jgi:hypothetical protein
MLPERREEVRKLLRDYVDTRLQAVESKKIAEGIRRSEQLQEQLWAQAVTLGERHPTSIVVGLCVQSLNLIGDLDRPQEGTLTVSQQALVDLRLSMQGSRPP